jgi:hypothetical protein
LSRHRKIHVSRSPVIALIVVGAFCVAAATAAAVTSTPGPSRPAPGSAHDAGGGVSLTVTDQMTKLQAFPQASAIQAPRAYQIRDAEAELAVARWKAAQQRAAEQAAKAAAARAAAAARSTAQPTAGSTAQSAAGAQPTQTGTAAAAPAASGSPQQIAEAMLGSFGWSPSQFSCLDPLWAHESGWSVTADNAGSGAYGIPQALPGSRMASAGPNWQTDAATQIRWGLEYISGTYGSPCGAWDHEQATGWY